MLRRDPNLPFLEVAWSAAAMTQFFNRHVLPVVSPGRQLTQVAIGRMTYTPGRDCVALYALGPERDPVAGGHALVTFSADERLEEVHARYYRANGAPSAGGAPARAVSIPAYRCLVEVFPADWRLPSLARVLDGEQAGPILAANGIGAGKETDLDVTVLRYRAHNRCLLLLASAPPAGGQVREMIGKVYKEGRRAAEVEKKHRTLHARGAAEGLTVPQPLAVVDELNLLLMERLPGTPMHHLVRHGRGDDDDLTARAADVLATLHGIRLDLPEARSLASEIARLRDRAGQLQLVAPQLAADVYTILDRIEAAGQRLGQADPTVIHGDFTPGQLLVTEAGTTLLDLDRLCLGDPAHDIGHCMAAFVKAAVRTGQDELRRLPEVFLAEYERRTSSEGIRERARVFQSLMLVGMAIRQFRHAPLTYAQGGSSSRSPVLLQEAVSCLGAVAGR